MLRTLALVLLAASLPLMGCGGNSGSGTPGAPAVTTTEASVDITAGTVVLSEQPTNYTVTGTASDDGGGNATVNLTVTSAHSRLVFNLKAVVTAISDGAAAAGNTYQGDRYFYFGSEALAPGAMDTASLMITGLGGTTFTMTLEWVDHPMALVPTSQGGDLIAADSSGTGEEATVAISNLGFDGDGGAMDGAVSPDGRFVYLGLRNQPAILVVDLTTLAAVMSVDLTGQADLQTDGTGSVGFTGGVCMSPDGQHLFVALTQGMHASASYGNGGNLNGNIGATTTCSIVKLDRATLMEVDRVDLLTNDAALPQAKSILISSFGNRVAVALNAVGMVAVVETSDLSVIDADPVTMGTQLFDVSGFSDDPRRVALDAMGARVYVSYPGSATAPSNAIQRIDVGPLMITTLPQGPLLGATAKGNVYQPDIRVDGAGRLHVGCAYTEGDPAIPGVATWDPNTLMWSERHDDTSPNAMGFDGAGRLIFYHNPGSSDDRFYVMDPATGTFVTPAAMPGTDYVSIGTNGHGHLCLITPF